MNLVSRYSVKDPNLLASTASESQGKTKSESQNVPLSSLNEQQTRTGRPVMGASSSHYSEWNIDDKWSSQEWTYILGIKIDFRLPLVSGEYRRIVQSRLISNLLRSIVWITSGLLTISSNVPHIFAIGFPVALH